MENLQKGQKGSSEDIVDLLILGLGWQGSYIKNYWENQLGKRVASTTRDGRLQSIKWAFDPSLAQNIEFWKVLPVAKSVIITFPLPSEESGSLIINMYSALVKSASHATAPSFILLGSTRAFHGVVGNPWCNRKGPMNSADARIKAEDWFLRSGGVVLNLSGLWGGERQPKNWIADKIAPTKDALAIKKSVHLIHGLDVARLTYAVTQDMTPGQRWLVTDLRVYDWWDLILNIDEGDGSETRRAWILELIAGSKSRSTPRNIDLEMERAIDSKETWLRFNMLPNQTLYRPL